MFDLLNSLGGVSPTLKRCSELQRGARFFKCAFQVNPYGYTLRHSKQETAFASQEDYNSAMVAAARDAGMDVVALTDHFRVETAESLRAAFEAEGIVVFPGFEACSSEGVHLLCLHPPGTDLHRMQTYIGDCQIRDLDAESPQSRLGVEQLMRLTGERGGLVIAAHVTSKSGLLHHISGGTRIGAWRSPHLHAAAIPGRVADVTDQSHRSILNNSDPEYRRDHTLAIMNASDVSHPSHFVLGRSWCRVKMAELTIEGLRQAFLAPDTRIRLSSEEVGLDSAEIAAISWDGGFLDGQAVRLNNGLNVLIGGRGAGKSLLIESIRHVMGHDAKGPFARSNHEALVRNVLGPHTRVSLLLREAAPSAGWYVIERTGSTAPIVRGSDGSIRSGLHPSALIDDLEIYGQHELSELTRNKELLAGLLRRYLNEEPLVVAERQKTERALVASREDIARRTRELDRLEADVGGLDNLRHRKSQMDGLGAQEKLAEKVAFDAEYSNTVVRRDIMKDLYDQVQQLILTIVELPSRHPDLEGTDLVARTSKAGTEQATALRQTFEGGIEELEAMLVTLEARKQEIAERLRPIEEELTKQGIDVATYEQLATDIAALEAKAEELTAGREALLQARAARSALLEKRAAQVSALYMTSERAAKAAGRALDGRVRVTIRESQDLSRLRALLDEHVAGAGPSNAIDRLSERDAFSFRDFADTIRVGGDALRTSYSLAVAASRNVAAAGEALALEVEELVQPPAAEIALNVGEDDAPRWKSIDDLSAGQKATAVLLLLLGGAKSPLIVDQPEDDLDNRFVANTIVGTIRREKRHRQFIFSSHNANIPVLGDADQIVTLVPMSEKGLEHSVISEDETGAIDQPGVRAAVERLLEGGRIAFEKRRTRYGY